MPQSMPPTGQATQYHMAEVPSGSKLDGSGDERSASHLVTDWRETPQQHGELLLGHVALCAQVLKVVPEAHGGTSSLFSLSVSRRGLVLSIP